MDWLNYEINMVIYKDNSIPKPPGCIKTPHKYFAYPETLYRHSEQWIDLRDFLASAHVTFLF